MVQPDVTMMFVVHNALRRDLDRMRRAATQAQIPAAQAALDSSWTTFRRYLTIHHVAEDEMLWPPMRAKLRGRPGETALLDEMADEHARLTPLLGEIDDALGSHVPARLSELLAELITVLTEHFDHEESAAVPLVRQTLTIQEWTAFGDDQRRRIGFDGAAWFFPWLLDDTDPSTRQSVLGLVPAPVRLIFRLIWEPRYRRRSPWRDAPLTNQ